MDYTRVSAFEPSSVIIINSIEHHPSGTYIVVWFLVFDKETCMWK